MPLIVAIFLVIGGLLSSLSILGSKTGAIEVASAHRSTEFLISTAQGAEIAATLFGAQTPSPVTAVSGDGTLNARSVFSAMLGAVKDPGSNSGPRPVQISSLSR